MRFGAVLGAGLVAVLLSGCSAAPDAQTHPAASTGGPNLAVLSGYPTATSGLVAAPPLPRSAATALANFRTFVRAQAEGEPFTVTYVLTTYGPAEAQVTPGDTDSTDPTLPAIAMSATGHFDGSAEKGPPGYRPPPATSIAAAVLLPSLGFACWSEGDGAPDLAALGTVHAG